MSNVFIFTGQSIEEANVLTDVYLQLILIQYSIKSVSAHKAFLENNIENNTHTINSKEQLLDELKTLRTVHAFLLEWSSKLNVVCENPEDLPNAQTKKLTH